ncbi:hypothetical protein ACIA03_14225 [Nocardioides sp. NPDC051685]|uniref:hypothetical protein n=1 Tax=Nocardioides sp. NPDC051685 TaxID=3364334 RepID=UPI00379B09D3
MNNPEETVAGDARWHEYAVGMRAEWAYAVGFVMVPFLGGLVVSFVSMIVIGVVGEEGLITDVLARWIPLYRAQDVSDNLDLLLRISILPLGAFAYLAFLAITLAETVVEARVSKALFAAADDSDSRLVPPPSQIRQVESEPLESMRIFAKMNLWVGGVAVAMLVLFAVVEESAKGWLAVLVVAAYTIGLRVGVDKLRARLTGRQQRWREQVAARWPEEAENAVRARAAKKPTSVQEGDIEGAPGGRLRALARTLVLLPGGLALVAVFLMQIGLAVRHPGSSKYELADAAEYDAAGETLLSGIWWLMLAVVVVCVLMILASAVLAQVGTSAMERWLRERAADPTTDRPPYQVLLGFSERQGLPALKGMGFVAGLVSVFGTGLVLLGSLDMGGFADIYSGSDQIFGAYVSPALGLIGATAFLVLICMGLQVWQTVSEREFRNLLRERWPIRPPGVGQRKSDEAANAT